MVERSTESAHSYTTVNEVLNEYGALRRALVITALPLEFDAVRTHLDDIGSVTMPGKQIFECGSFRDINGEWLVVLVECGRGNAEAQSAVENAHRAFEKFDVQLMIGVGGALKEELSIGSVVASDRVYLVRSAKHNPDSVSSRPKSISADVDMVEIAKKVARDKAWFERVLNPQTKTEEPYNGEWPPDALVAPIGSSDEVLADANSALANWLTERYGDACVIEMEGYGAMFAASREKTPAIVVRGISDFASAEKTAKQDADTQPIAACHAAAFGFEMLCHWAAARKVEPVTNRDSHTTTTTTGTEVSDDTKRTLDEIREQCASASEVLLRWPRTLPNGEEIWRPELQELVNRIEGHSASTTILVGDPGCGKSSMLSALAHHYVERDWTVLAIRGDLINRDVSRESELGDSWSLGMKPSDAVTTVAKAESMLLIIDQLDTLAEFLDLRTSRLNVLIGLVNKVCGVENVHIVLSSRMFEYQHDLRLRSLDAVCLTLELPAWSQVLEILELKGISAGEWPLDAQEVIRSPQALGIYLDIASENMEPFSSYQQMLDALWHERVAGGESGIEKSRVAAKIAEIMAQEESLWLAAARFDDEIKHVEKLTAIGVLRRSTGRIGFAHQTLFEHVLARRFARVGGALSSFVFARQDSLFIRPKLLAGMNYLRAMDESMYHAELERLWTEQDLRRHIRVLLIDYLASQSHPTEREVVVMGLALADPDLRWHAFRAISANGCWFETLAEGFVVPIMKEHGEAARRIVGILVTAWQSCPDRVAEILDEVWGRDSKFDLLIWGVLSRVREWPNRALRIAEKVISRTEIPTNDVNYVAETLSVAQPDIALRLLYSCLQREFQQVHDTAFEIEETSNVTGSGERRVSNESSQILRERSLENLVDGRQDLSALPKLAKEVPGMFLKTLWPWFEEVLRALLDLEENTDRDISYQLAFVADFRFTEEGADLPSSDPLTALRISTEELVDAEPQTWLSWVGRFSELDAMTTHRLIAHGFAHSPERFKHDSIRYLLEDKRRFMLGSMMNPTSTSQRLIHSASKHWSTSQLSLLEQALDDYRPSAPAYFVKANERHKWHQTVKGIRHSLRQALPDGRRSTESQQSIEKDSRTFPDDTLQSDVSFGLIGSVMDSEMMKKASDDDIVSAFRKLPDATGWDHPVRLMVGGNIQLSRAFGVFATENAVRAARILQRLTPDNGTRAAGNVIEVLAGKADPELVKTILRDSLSRGFDSQEYRESACRAIIRLVKNESTEIEDDLVEVVESWLPLTETDRISAGEGEAVKVGLEGVQEAVTKPVFSSTYVNDSPHDVVHNSILWGTGRLMPVPGGDLPILECIAHLRTRQGEYKKLGRLMHEYLDRCAELKVWMHLLHFLRDPPADWADGAGALVKRVLAEVPGIVATASATSLITGAALRWNPDLANEELPRWRDAEDTAARQAYGEVVALAVTAKHKVDWAEKRLAEIVENTSLSEARAGAVLTAVNRWQDGSGTERKLEIIVTLLSQGETGVWKAVFDLFRLVDRLLPDPETVQLLKEISGRIGDAPVVDISFLLEKLGTLLPHHAQLVAELAMGLARRQTQIGGLAGANLVDLAITLHRLGGETQRAGTDLLEILLSKEVIEAVTTLREIDKNRGNS